MTENNHYHYYYHYICMVCLLFRSCEDYLSFAVLVAPNRELIEHGQQMEGLLWLEGQQVQVDQQEANRLSKLLF